MATGDIWHVAFTGTIESQLYVNGWNFRLKSPTATVEDCVDYVVTNFYDLAKTVLSTHWSILAANCRQMVEPANLFDKTLSVLGADSASDLMPPQCCCVATLRTGIAGRSRRGRLYLGGFTEGDMAWGQVASGRVSSLQTYFDDLVAGIGSGGSNPDIEWGVWSKKLGEPSPGVYNLSNGWRPITEVLVRTTVYTQRRRTLGHGA